MLKTGQGDDRSDQSESGAKGVDSRATAAGLEDARINAKNENGRSKGRGIDPVAERGEGASELADN